MNVVSLLASAYSGSTILSMALGSSPSIGAFGDTYYDPAHPSHRCSCGALFRECTLRRRMNDRLARYGFPDYWDTAAPLPAGGPLLERPYLYLKRRVSGRAAVVDRALNAALAGPGYRARFRREHDAFFTVLREETGATHYLDGCKSPARAQLMLDAYPSSRILHLVRDPRGYLASFAVHTKQRTGQYPDRPRMQTALAWWKRDNSLAAHYEKLLSPGCYLRVQFADLLAAPEETLQRVLDFCGVDGDAAELCRFNRSRLHVSGNTTNLVSTRIETRPPGTWARHADILDLPAIEAATRSLAFVRLERPGSNWAAAEA